MERRLTAIDYDAIYQFTEQEGRGSIARAATNWGITYQTVTALRVVYNAVLQDKLIPDTYKSRYKTLIDAAKKCKLRTQGNDNIRFVSDSLITTNVKPDNKQAAKSLVDLTESDTNFAAAISTDTHAKVLFDLLLSRLQNNNKI